MFKRYWVLAAEGDIIGAIGSGLRQVDVAEHPITVDVKSPWVDDLPTVTITQGEWLSLPHIDLEQCQGWTFGRIINHLRKYKEPRHEREHVHTTLVSQMEQAERSGPEISS